jgi:PAS domain S-box-containing protein
MNAKIFIVEDQALILAHLKKQLRSSGFIISGDANTGASAIEKINTHPPDLILMDVYIQGEMDGIETVKKIQKNHNIPVIYLTSSNDDTIVERAKSTSPYGYLPKSANQSILVRTIEFALSNHQKELEKIKIQNELAETHELFSQMISLSKDAMLVINEDKTIQVWNNAAENMFGFSSAEVLGKNLINLIIEHSDEQFYNSEFEKAIAGEKSELFNSESYGYCVKSNGIVFPTKFKFTISNHKNNKVICANIADITKRVEHELYLKNIINQLKEANEKSDEYNKELNNFNLKLKQKELELLELNANKDRFFSIIAHGLKGPFQALLGYSSLLANDIESFSFEEISEFATNLHQSTNNLFKLLENLLQWSMVQRGNFQIEAKRLNFSELVNHNLEIAKSRAKHKSIILSTDISEEFIIFADENMINTVIRNLLSNSIKFCNKNDKITISANKLNDKLEIKITDTGVGMSPELSAKLFRLDSKTSSIGTSGEHGTGLGLLLCKELVEKNQGKIWVESMLGKGTTMFFTVPLFQN